MAHLRNNPDPFVVISTREEDFSRSNLPEGKDPLYGPWGEHGTRGPLCSISFA